MVSRSIHYRRLINDQHIIAKDPHEFIDLVYDKYDISTSYFMIKGPKNSEYDGGYYIGRITYNDDYPMSAPNFVMFTPSGRFKVETKICSLRPGYSCDSWSPMWSIHAVLTFLLSIMINDSIDDNISCILCTKEERNDLAKKSIEYNKKNYPTIFKLFTRFIDKNGNPLQDLLISDVELTKKPIENLKKFVKNNINMMYDHIDSIEETVESLICNDKDRWKYLIKLETKCKYNNIKSLENNESTTKQITDLQQKYDELYNLINNKQQYNNNYTSQTIDLDDPSHEETTDLNTLIKSYYNLIKQSSIDKSKWFIINKEGVDHLMLFQGQEIIKDYYIDIINLCFCGINGPLIFTSEEELCNYIKFQIECL